MFNAFRIFGLSSYITFSVDLLSKGKNELIRPFQAFHEINGLRNYFLIHPHDVKSD